jgi:regulator of protease activity HflC (stomatin/prohibitin superfamily)
MKRIPEIAYRTSRALGLRIDRQTTLIKGIIILALNLIGFVLASLVSPAPPAQERAVWEVTLFFPGGLHVLGEIVATVLGAILNWRALGYLFIANVAAAIPLLFGALFVRQLYQFDSFTLALGYLIDAFLVPAYYYLDLQPGRDAAHPDHRRGMGGPRIALFKDGKLVPAGKQPRNRSIAWAGGPGMVVVPPEYAVQLERDGRLSYVVGPGVVRLGRFERVYKPVHLRQIVRKNTATAHTRDGIPVTVEVTVQARVRASALATKKNPYPFDKDAVRKLIISTPAHKSNHKAELIAWEERPVLLVNTVLNEVLGKYRLDELLDPLDDTLQTPRPTIHQEVWRALRQRARGFGLDVTEVWLGEFQLPAEVTEQYLAYWQADWQRQDRTRLADSQASHIRQMNRARAEAQQLIIETLIAAFQSAQDSGLGIAQKQLAALRLIDGLEQLYHQMDLAEGKPDRKVIALERHLTRLRDTVQIREPRPEKETQDAGD